MSGRLVAAYGNFTQADVDAGRVVFRHDGGEDFLATAGLIVSNGSSAVSLTRDIDITPVNDAPTLGVGGTVVVPEGGDASIDRTLLQPGDVDGAGSDKSTGFAAPNTVTLTVTRLPTHGTLLLDGVAVTAATAIPVAALDAPGRLRYVHDGTESFADDFDVQASDEHGAQSPVRTVPVEVTSLDDSPVVTRNEPLAVAEGAEGAIPTSLLSASDPDNTTQQRQYRVVSDVRFGTLLLDGRALGTGSIFTQADIEAGRLSYRHDGSENYADAFDFRVGDGVATTPTQTFRVTVTPSNDAPALAVPGRQLFGTAAPLVFSGANGNAITVSDVDYTQPAGIASDLMPGHARPASGRRHLGGGEPHARQRVRPDLHRRRGRPGPDGVPRQQGPGGRRPRGPGPQVPTDEDRALRLVVTVDDLNNGGPDPAGATPGYRVVTHGVDILASRDNDPPAPSVPPTQTVGEDAGLVFSAAGGNPITVSDPDGFDLPVRVTLTGTNGTFLLPAGGTGTLVLQGATAQINAALDGLTYRPGADYNGPASITVTVDDQNNLGEGGSQTASQGIAVTVRPVNDAPSVSASNPGPLRADSADLLFGPGDASSVTFEYRNDGTSAVNDLVRMRVEAAGGGSLLVDDPAGAAVSGDGTSAVVIEGTRAGVNTALESLRYSRADDADSLVTLTFTADDLANGGEAVGGVGGALTAQRTIAVQASSSNDAPVLFVPSARTVAEDGILTITGVSVSDPDAFDVPLTVTLGVTRGTVSLATVTGLSFARAMARATRR